MDDDNEDFGCTSSLKIVPPQAAGISKVMVSGVMGMEEGCPPSLSLLEHRLAEVVDLIVFLPLLFLSVMVLAVLAPFVFDSFLLCRFNFAVVDWDREIADTLSLLALILLLDLRREDFLDATVDRMDKDGNVDESNTSVAAAMAVE